MATIPHQGTEWRRVRKTFTNFDGSPGNGAHGDLIFAFSLTGRVLIDCQRIVVWVEGLSLIEPSAYISLGQNTESEEHYDEEHYDELWYAALDDDSEGHEDYGYLSNWFGYPTLSGYPSSSPDERIFAPICHDLYVTFMPYYDWVDLGEPLFAASKLVIDLWYMPLTDDGALTGDDTDEPLADSIADAMSGSGLALEATAQAIKAKTDNLPAQPAAAGDIPSASAIAEEVWDTVDSEVSGVPAANASFRKKLGWLFTLARNKRTQTTTTETVYADDGSTPIATSAKSDDGSTFTRGEYQ